MNQSLRLSPSVVVLAALAAFAAGCSKSQPPDVAGAPASPPVAAKAATGVADSRLTVCLFDGLGVRAEVGKNAKVISSLFLGETMQWTGATEKDEAGRDYLKVELSDGKAGWVLASGVETGAQMGALREETIAYKRPDPVTATPQKIPFMTIVAVTQQKDDWLQIVGESRKPLGWVKKDAVAVGKEDVTDAIVATRKLREKDGLDLPRKVEEIAKRLPNPNSYFVQKLREKSGPAVAAVAESKPADPAAAAGAVTPGAVTPGANPGAAPAGDSATKN